MGTYNTGGIAGEQPGVWGTIWGEAKRGGAYVVDSLANAFRIEIQIGDGDKTSPDTTTPTTTTQPALDPAVKYLVVALVALVGYKVLTD